MKFMKGIRFSTQLLALATAIFWLAGCATTTKQTEQLLTQAGFQRYPANSETKLKHMMTLPADKLTIARINGQPYYVFPDPANRQIFVGNAEQFQTYQQILSYHQLEADSHILAVEDKGPGDDTGKWAEWTSTTGWTHGTYNY